MSWITTFATTVTEVTIKMCFWYAIFVNSTAVTFTVTPAFAIFFLKANGTVRTAKNLSD